MKYNFKNLIIITGHYGCGKTNLAINLAIKLKESRQKVILADMDIVNPYFRTSDSKELLEEKGIKVLTPLFAGSNLDIPALTAEMDALADIKDGFVIMDVGGDKEGATVLGRYAKRILKREYEMLYVFSAYRYMTYTPQGAYELLKEIQEASGLLATSLVNNSNLGVKTSSDTILASEEFTRRLEELSGLKVKFTCADEKFKDITGEFFYIKNYIKAPWD